MANNFSSAMESAYAGLDAIQAKLAEIQKDALKTAENVGRIVKGSNSNTPNGASKSLHDITMNMSELEKKVNLYLGLQKDMQKQWKANITAANQYGSNMKALNTQRERAIKSAQKEAAANEKASRAYNKINKALQHAKQEYRDLRARKEMSLSLTDKEILKMERLEAAILKMDGALKKTDSRMGVNTRSVGNYGKAFDSLGFSVAQITRESPAFINSMQTGFMAISNNIPTLVDEIEKLKIKNADLVANQKSSIPIWKSLGRAIFSYQTAISAGILLLTVAGPAIIKWINKVTKTAEVTDGAAASQKAFNETLREGAADATTAQTQFDNLNNALKSGNLTREQQLKTAKKMKDLYPDILKDMTEEEIITKGIGDNYELITQKIARMSAMKAVSNRMSEIAGDRLKAELEMEDAALKAQAIRLAMDSEVGSQWMGIQLRKLWLMGDEASALQLSADKQSEVNKLDKEKDRIQKFINKNIRDFIDLTTEAIELEEEKEEKTKDYALFTIAHYKDLISQNEKVINQKLTMSEKDREQAAHLRTLNAFYQKQIELLGGVNKKKKEEEVYLEGSIGHYKKLIAANEKLLKHTTNNAAWEKINKENEALKTQVEIIEGLADDWIELGEAQDAKEQPNIEKWLGASAGKVLEPWSEGTQVALEDIEEIIEREDPFGAWVDGFEPMFKKLNSAWGNTVQWFGKDIGKLKEDFMVLYEAMGGDVEDEKAMEKAFLNFVKGEEEKIKRLAQLMSQTAALVGGFISTMFERNIEQLEQEKTAIEERYDLEMLKAEETFTTKAALDDKQRFLEEKKARDLRKNQDKINAERKKQAIAEKSAAVAQIAINTAIGVSSAFKSGVFLGGLEAALILANGALQTAIVLAQPIPQYKHGTESHPGGRAVVGDGGKAEAAITPDGSIYKTPNKATIVDLPKGTMVKPDYGKYMSEQQKMVYDSNMLASMTIDMVEKDRDRQLLNAILKQTDVLRAKKMETKIKTERTDISHDLWKLKNISW